MIGGSLCSGSGGLDLGLGRALDVEWAWHAEIDPAASAILDAHWPGVPNLGDFTEIRWEDVPRVEFFAAGFPCPDYSLAGRRAGIDGEHGQVWHSVARALRALRPAVVVLENVDGIRSASGPVGGGPGDTALGVVLADLAELGYRWAYDRLRAADVGAPHGRLRWFCVAALPSAADAVGVGDDADGRVRGRDPGVPGRRGSAPSAVPAGPEVDEPADALEDGPGAAADAERERLDGGGTRDARGAPSQRADGGGALRDLPRLLGAGPAADAGGVARPEAGELDGGPGAGEEPRARGEAGEAELRAAGRDSGRGKEPVGKLLPTPTAGDGKASGSRNLEGSKAHPGVSLTDAVQTGDSMTPRRLLPTPTAEDGERGHDGAGSDRLGAATFDGDVRLLPTPQAADGVGGRMERGAMERDGKRPSGHKATLPLPTAVEMRESLSETPFAQDAGDDQLVLLPTPVANPDNPGAGGELRAAVVHGEGRRNETGVDTLGRPNEGRPSKLMPTPTTQDAENTAGDSQRDRHSDPLNVVAADLLPTPTAADGDRTSEQGPRYYIEGDDNPTLLGAARRSEVEWGVYEAAVRRWEQVFGYPAPTPTDEKGRLAPEFVEWMLGYPPGWFDVPGIARTKKLRALGNSVQVQCGEAVGYWLAGLIRSGLLIEVA